MGNIGIDDSGRVPNSGDAARTGIKSKAPVGLPAAANFVSSTASSDRRRHLRRIESKAADRSGSSRDARILLFAEKTFARQSNAEWLTTDYDFDVAAKVWRRPSPQAAWRYSDGDEAEQRLADIVNSASDRSVDSPEIANQITDWPSRYHLDARRSNLLRALGDKLEGSVLEVGAGCGAVTRYLGELGLDVVAVEGGARRAAIAASRCLDLSNVAVVADDFRRLPRGKLFNVVTLIGVLEYARVYFSGDSQDPVADLLARCVEFLRPGGILVIAIENQLGLKYFSGCREDHVGQSMFGIQDLYQPEGVVTFGRRELGAYIERAGLTHQQWWFPQPDYKLPVSILSDRLEDSDVEADLSGLLSESVRCDAQPAPAPTFSLEQAWGVVYRNKLFGELANSFLVVASASPLSKHNVLAIHYSDQRLPEFKKLVRFEWNSPNVTVHREPFHPGRTSRTEQISLRLEDEVMQFGKLWHGVLVTILNVEGWTGDQWCDWALQWFHAVLKTAGLNAGHYPPPTQEISGDLLDAIPRNLSIRNDGGIVFFDLEWQSEKPVELGYLVFRALCDALNTIGSCARPAAGTPTAVSNLFDHFARAIGWRLSTEDVRRYVNEEVRFQQLVCGRPAPVLLSLHRSLPVRERLEDIQSLRADLANKLEETEQRLGWVEAAMAALSDRCTRQMKRRIFKRLQALLRLPLFNPPVSRTLYDLVNTSSLFDRHHYLGSNPDVVASGLDPVVHYLLYGSAEGRDPARFFSETAYRARNPDVGAANISAVQHYEMFGRREGRRCL
jgi:SAM-dependent methyltransferase